MCCVGSIYLLISVSSAVAILSWNVSAEERITLWAQQFIGHPSMLTCPIDWLLCSASLILPSQNALRHAWVVLRQDCLLVHWNCSPSLIISCHWHLMECHCFTMLPFHICAFLGSCVSSCNTLQIIKIQDRLCFLSDTLWNQINKKVFRQKHIIYKTLVNLFWLYFWFFAYF